MTATSADGCCTNRRLATVVGPGGGLGEVAERVPKEVDRLALEAEPDVGVHGRGYADVGMTQEFLDDDEFDALFEEEGGRRVPEVVEADAAEPRAVHQAPEPVESQLMVDGLASGDA